MARIVLVEDDQEVLESLSRVLEGDGHEVLQATSGRACLSLVASGPVDLVIADVNMAEMDGLELLREVRQRTRIPVILITGGGMFDASLLIELGRAMGAAAGLTKPFTFEELRAAVKAALTPPDHTNSGVA